MSKPLKATALKYIPGQDHAPMIVASGHGIIAQKMIEIAEQSGIPVYRDEQLANVLSMLDIGSAIDQELFQLVAQIYIEVVMALKTSNDNPR